MSEKINHFFAAGVFKLDYTAAGFPDLIKIAREWAKDPNFFELIVRGVSEKNFGIQFVYSARDVQGSPMKQYRQELVERFGKGLYATDYQEISSSDAFHPREGIVVMKGLPVS